MHLLPAVVGELLQWAIILRVTMTAIIFVRGLFVYWPRLVASLLITSVIAVA